MGSLGSRVNRCDQLAQRAYGHGEGLAAERVAVAAPVRRCADESLLAKSFEMVADECLAEPRCMLDFLDAAWTVGQEDHHREAVFISERL